MNEVTKLMNSDSLKEIIIIDKVKCPKEIPQNIKLCIIQCDLEKKELSALKKMISQNKNIEFWIASNNLSRENILKANKLGINTVVSTPIDLKGVVDYLNQKNSLSSQMDTIYKINEIDSCKVMIVDDNEMNIELLKEVLSEFNIKITSFLKPKEACKKIAEEKFDLFLLDVMMPELSGFDLAEVIKATHHNKDSPIVFISALSDNDNKIKGYNLGSYAYIEKPFDVNLIKSQIFGILKNQKSKELTESNKEAFLATVAHDLKTPINAGINALNLLLNENLGELEQDQQEIVEDLLNSTKFMKEMVENILCKNRIEANEINLSKQICSLEELLKHSIEITKYVLEPRKQKIKFKCEYENTLIPIDFLEMKRVIHNLISNASEYSQPNEEIHVTMLKNPTHTGFFVQDFGKGIDIAHHADVFKQYITFAKKEKRVGSGLGLYISKRIVEAHGGEIKIDSKLGQGTKITVLLPNYSKE